MKRFLNTRDEDGWTSLLLALMAGHESTARELIARGANLKDITGHGKETALILAAAARTPNMVKHLLELGMHVDAIDSRGWTSLRIAVQCNDSVSTNLLIEAGADPDIVDQYGESCLTLAASMGNIDVLLLLLKRSRQMWEDEAARRGRRRLLEFAPFDGVSKAGRKPLRHATVSLVEDVVFRGGRRQLLSLPLAEADDVLASHRRRQRQRRRAWKDKKRVTGRDESGTLGWDDRGPDFTLAMPSNVFYTVSVRVVVAVLEEKKDGDGGDENVLNEDYDPEVDDPADRYITRAANKNQSVQEELEIVVRATYGSANRGGPVRACIPRVFTPERMRCIRCIRSLAI